VTLTPAEGDLSRGRTLQVAASPASRAAANQVI